MSQITLDSHSIEKLVAVTHAVDVCDKSGRVVGKFIPTVDSSGIDREPKITEEELRRRMREIGGRSLSEIMADLEKRS